MTSREFRTRLQKRAQRAGLTVSSDLATRLWTYYELLERWNHKINLTSLPLDSAPDQTLDRLIFEPLVAVRHLQLSSGHMVDIGSGSGSPAVPVKLIVPALQLTMVESKTRKGAFLREVARQLELEHTQVVTARFEELLTRPDLHEAADLITIRAVRMEAKRLLTLQAFLRPGGRLALFQRAGGSDAPPVVTAPLQYLQTFALVEASRATLVVLEKLRTPTWTVPRGTPGQSGPSGP